MGRRKIEIKPIRDDRNRSVTFLKRKGGLFKKAHELSVLCSVDVAVIIFGHNKKLYEYSSGDINETIGRFQYYGGAHEHKGPADFKNGGDEDEEDEDGGDDIPDERGTPDQRAMMQPGMQNHPGFQHVRHGTPTQSPPMPNGAMPQFQRGPSPLPPNSRPASRLSQNGGGTPAHIRRASSNMAPQAHQPNMQGPPPPGTYAYQPNQPYYAPPQAQMPRPPGQATYPPPNYPHHMQHAHMQQAMQDQRRSSVPPAFPPHGTPPQQHLQRVPSQEHLRPPHPQQQPHMSPQPSMQRATPSPQPPQHQQFASPPIPQPRPMPAHAKAASIFTPIDDSRSLLAQHWTTTTTEPSIKAEVGRSASVDVAAMQRARVKAEAAASSTQPRAAKAAPNKANQAQRQSVPSAVPARANTNTSDAKRPRLKVQIPSEHSGDEAGTANSEAPSTSNPSGVNGSQQTGPSHGVVLPPPSPSANALLSAGAQGPPNPFARPPPPMTTNPHAANRDANHIETPMSALPSRFMNDNLLPSPSTFYPEWGFGRAGDSGMLPSPLNFQTPVVANGSSWREDDRKRAAEEEALGAGKRSKS